MGSQGAPINRTRFGSLTLADVSVCAYVLLSVAFDDGSLPVQVGRVVLIVGALTDLLVRPFTTNAIQLWQIAFVGFSALSVLWATDAAPATDMAKTLLINGICVIAITYLVHGSARRLNYFLACLMVAPAILMARVTLNHGIFAFLDTRSTDTTSANIVGMTAAFGVCIAYLGTSRGVIASRFTCIVFLASNFAVVFLSASRKAILVVGIVVLLYSLLDRRVKSATRFIRFAVVLAVALAAVWLILNVDFLYGLVGNRLETMVDGFRGSGEVDASTATRLNLIEDGMNWFRDSPWLGHGPDNFRVLMQIYHPHWVAYYAHNNFVEVLVDYGVAGFILFYWMYAFVIGTGIRRLRSLDPTQTMILCLMVSLLVIEYGFVDYYSRVFMPFVAVAWVALRGQAPEAGSPTVVSRQVQQRA